MFLTRAHAQGWETEILSYAEAQALSQRKREAGKAISNHSMLQEVRSRDDIVKKLQRQKKKNRNADTTKASMTFNPGMTNQEERDRELEIQPVSTSVEPITEAEAEVVKPKKLVPYVRVYDYEELKREVGWW